MHASLFKGGPAPLIREDCMGRVDLWSFSISHYLIYLFFNFLVFSLLNLLQSLNFDLVIYFSFSFTLFHIDPLVIS